MHYQPANDLLANHIILVTGASDGIGQEAAISYARYGAEVILLGRNQARLQQTQQQIERLGKKPAHTLLFDLADTTPENAQQLADQLTAQFPRLDGVLHNAGILGDVVPVAELDPKVWQQVMQINVDATFFLTQALLPLLLKSKAGSLVFTTSSVGRTGRAGWGAYAVSKFATEGLMQVMADEYKDQPLRVNCINPGGTRTKMRASAFPEENAGRLKTPADLMPLYLYLMGDDSKHESGISFDAQPGGIE